ncbi:MAG: hypothetical protein ACLU9X_09400 [Alistipes shahii]
MHVDRQRRRTDDKRAHAGINAVQHSAEQIREALAELPPCDGVTSVRFYGAGCGETFPEASEKLRRELEAHFGTTDITVESDLLGAVRALWGRGEGIACILGTGSNSCLCRDGEILKNVPPLGYVLGDEGSGADAGAQPGERHLQGAHSAERGVSRGARAELRGDHPPRLPRALRQPLSGLVRTFHTRAYRPPGDPGAGTPVVPRLCVPQPEPLSGGTPRIAAWAAWRPTSRRCCARRWKRRAAAWKPL